MERYLQLINARYSEFTDREKGLVMLCGFVAIIFGLLTVLLDPSYQTNKRLANEISQRQLAIQALESNNMVMSAKLRRDPDIDVDKQLKALTKQSLALSERSANVVKNFITPEAMAHLLEDVLTSSQELSLISLESLPAKPIIGQQSQSNTGYYLHPMRLEISGNYFAIQRYLSTLETFEAKYYWQSFEYQVASYPTATVVLHVYTLGTSEEFIGG
ncbi:MSHA biogenesis protein MshJ [Vibrio sp. AK197]